MDEEAFKGRTKGMAPRVVRLVEALPRGKTSEVVRGKSWLWRRIDGRGE